MNDEQELACFAVGGGTDGLCPERIKCPACTEQRNIKSNWRDHFREPTEQEAEAMFAKIMNGEIERQSFATFTAQNGPMPGSDEPLTLAKLEETLRRFDVIVGKCPLDTHIFCSAGGRQWIYAVTPVRKVEPDWLGNIRVNSLMGIEIWDDPTVPADEIQIGRVRWESEIVDGRVERKPYKIVTKTLKIA